MKIFDTIDSTNLHAIRLINEGLSVHGDVIISRHQTHGRGQREKKWQDVDNDSLLMTLTLLKDLDKMSIIDLSTMVSLSVLHILQEKTGLNDIQIKWPNDIFINGKKTSGILIENGFKGSRWNYSIIGIGVNVHQKWFDEGLTTATSLALESQESIDIVDLAQSISNRILTTIHAFHEDEAHLLNEEFHRHLFKVKDWVNIEILAEQKTVNLFFSHVDQWGRAVFYNDANEELTFNHGTIKWLV